MKISRLAGLAALAVLAVGQARAEPGQSGNGLGFGIIRDLAPVLRPVAMTPTSADEHGTIGSFRIERIETVRSDATRAE